MIALALFIVLLIVSLVFGLSMLIPLCAGMLLFGGAAKARGAVLKDVMRDALTGVKDSMVVVRIMLMIGLLTGLWRQSGTIAYFVDAGVRLMPPALYLPAMFLLSSFMSFALGTSFGVSATCGVILMAVCRAGGWNELLSAGAILSGIYVGDRGSPAASSASLVAAVTGTDARRNVRWMLKDSLAPYIACLVLYTALALLFPADRCDLTVLDMMKSEFSLSPWCLLPAAVMLILPFCGVKIVWSMAASTVVSAVTACLVQGADVLSVLKSAFLGYTAREAHLSQIFSGGGLMSMVEVSLVLLVSCTYSGIFRSAGLLDKTDKWLLAIRKKLGRTNLVILLSLAVSAVFCNQTIGIIMTASLSRCLYGSDEGHAYMADIEDSAVPCAALVPWCIAFSVPAGMVGRGAEVLPLTFWLWLVPLWAAVRRGRK